MDDKWASLFDPNRKRSRSVSSNSSTSSNSSNSSSSSERASNKHSNKNLSRTSLMGAPRNLPPLSFHRIHGENLKISSDRSTARRMKSYDNGIAFSARCVSVNEKICIRFLEISKAWTGTVRFGFTSHDPLSFAYALPKTAYALKTGNWSESLDKRFCEKYNTLYYYVNTFGDVYYGINGEEKGLFFSGVDLRFPLWALVDVYAECEAVQFVEPRALSQYKRAKHNQLQDLLLSSTMQSLSVKETSALQNQNQMVTPSFQRPKSANVNDRSVRRYMQNLSVKETLSAPQNQNQLVPPGPKVTNLNVNVNDRSVARSASCSMRLLSVEEPLPAPRYNKPLVPLSFHKTKGTNIQFAEDRGIAWRSESKFRRAYVFTAQPMHPGQTILVQILAIELGTYSGNLTFGFTSCDPATLDSSDLPFNPNLLVDRSEYWVIEPYAANGLRLKGELAFTLSTDGKVQVSLNGDVPIKVIHVDQTLKLWAFVDLNECTQKVKMFTSPNLSQERVQTHMQNPVVDLTGCEICFDQPIDSVLCMCGHMCLCYECAVKLWRSKEAAQCPLCQKVIILVVRTFKV